MSSVFSLIFSFEIDRQHFLHKTQITLYCQILSDFVKLHDKFDIIFLLFLVRRCFCLIISLYIQNEIIYRNFFHPVTTNHNKFNDIQWQEEKKNIETFQKNKTKLCSLS